MPISDSASSSPISSSFNGVAAPIPIITSDRNPQMAVDGALSVDLDHRHRPKLPPISPIKILAESMSIFSRNKRLFLIITLFLSCPVSFLLFSLSFSSFALRSRILRLEFLATVAPTYYESRQVWKESREVFLSLLRIKLLHLLPANLLAVVTAISAVDSAASGSKSTPTVRSAASAVWPAWTRVMATSICMYVISWMYAGVPATVTAMVAGGGGVGGGGGGWGVRFGIWVVGLGVEVYLMAVLGMGLVVSILEKKSGWEAVRVGSELMDGLRVCGWGLSGLFAVATGLVGWKMEELVAADGGNGLEEAWEESELMRWPAAEGWEGAALVVFYAVIVVSGFVVSTVFYKEARRRHEVRNQEYEILDA